MGGEKMTWPKMLAIVGSLVRRELSVKGRESLHLRLRFLQHTLGILTLRDISIVIPSSPPSRFASSGNG